MKVALVGSGNVATVLGNVIHSSGHQIIRVISRNKEHAEKLALNFGCEFGDYKSTSEQEADIYLLAITDTALYHFDQQMHFGNKVVVHTAGSVSKEVLKNISTKYGIIYPLQSLVMESFPAPDIPLMVDGNSNDTTQFIYSFAESFSKNVTIANDEERIKYHVAAVLVSNFTNHLFAMADDFCRKENIDFKMLLPLIRETTFRIQDHEPETVQTGPAIREDIYTLGKHLQVLSAHPDLKYLYLKLSESILKLYQKK